MLVNGPKVTSVISPGLLFIVSIRKSTALVSSYVEDLELIPISPIPSTPCTDCALADIGLKDLTC